ETRRSRSRCRPKRRHSSPSGITKATAKAVAFFMPWMYILYSKKLDKYYVGSCVNLERRLYEHNIGHSKFTSTGIPWEMVYKEEFQKEIEAKRRELGVKKMKSRKYIEECSAQGRASLY